MTFDEITALDDHDRREAFMKLLSDTASRQLVAKVRDQLPASGSVENLYDIATSIDPGLAYAHKPTSSFLKEGRDSAEETALSWCREIYEPARRKVVGKVVGSLGPTYALRSLVGPSSHSGRAPDRTLSTSEDTAGLVYLYDEIAGRFVADNLQICSADQHGRISAEPGWVLFGHKRTADPGYRLLTVIIDGEPDTTVCLDLVHHSATRVLFRCMLVGPCQMRIKYEVPYRVHDLELRLANLEGSVQRLKPKLLSY